VGGILAQMVIALGLVLLVGHSAGRRLIDAAVLGSGFTAPSWQGHGGFDTLLKCTSPVFWAFFLLTGISLFVLRMKDRTLERPFSVPFYPVLPLIFCATCAGMLYSSIDYAGKLVWVGFAPPLAGLILYFLVGRRMVTKKSV
jgi:APA family basic amino acid/polyamine antiporter